MMGQDHSNFQVKRHPVRLIVLGWSKFMASRAVEIICSIVKWKCSQKTANSGYIKCVIQLCRCVHMDDCYARCFHKCSRLPAHSHVATLVIFSCWCSKVFNICHTSLFLCNKALRTGCELLSWHERMHSSAPILQSGFLSHSVIDS